MQSASIGGCIAVLSGEKPVKFQVRHLLWGFLLALAGCSAFEGSELPNVELVLCTRIKIVDCKAATPSCHNVASLPHAGGIAREGYHT